MVTILEGIILGVIQGVAEWFPVSSSGHLVIFQELLGVSPPIAFDVALHFASLLVILFVFREKIIELINGLINREKEKINYILMLALASVPIASVGYFLNDFIKSIFTVKTTGISLIFTAFILFLSQYNNKEEKLSFLNTFLIGIGQAFAILPGISRSGITISAGLIQGIEKEKAAEFSFLLVIPAIIGANLLEIRNITAVSTVPLIISMLAAMITGVLTLKYLLKIIKKGKLHYFSIYCLILGLLILILF